MKTTTVEVTREHIELGQRCDPCNCPVALAIKAARPDLEPYVSEECVSFDLDEDVEDTAVYLNSWVSSKIGTFDANLGMVPFSFEIELPEAR